MPPNPPIDAHTYLPTLRAEAVEVKQCFATYCFQVFAFNSGVLAVVAAYGDTHPALQLTAALVAVLSLAVARIGTYKYATANRNYGFELFVDRIARMKPDVAARYTEATLAIGWEEGLRAWRIVQASIFERLYHHGTWPNLRTPENRAASASDQGAWWDVPSLVRKAHVAYYPGSYLESMLSLLGFFTVVSWIPLISLCVDARDPDHAYFISRHFLWGLTGLFVATSAYGLWFLNVRRHLLESTLLSIHSCSIMWEVVVVAHLRAVRQIENHHFNGYTRALAQIIAAVSDKDLHHIHDWLRPPPSKPSRVDKLRSP